MSALTPRLGQWSEGQTRPRTGRVLGERLFEDGYGRRDGLNDGWFVEVFAVVGDAGRVLLHYCGGPFSRFARSCGNATGGSEVVRLVSRQYGLRKARQLASY